MEKQIIGKDNYDYIQTFIDISNLTPEQWNILSKTHPEKVAEFKKWLKDNFQTKMEDNKK